MEKIPPGQPAYSLCDVEISAIRAQGAGGQNVNKVSCAVHLRFDIPASSLADVLKERLLRLNDQRINSDGVLVIKAQEYRSLEKNRVEALRRLQELIASVASTPRLRRATKPTRGSKLRRLESKSKRGEIKTSRGKVES
ncbi:MAG: alternative ribosome rescue aminoacyl-tRNA hydrolase ArfB [Proteobacteria bacterium]|nr:alternative ribosome rescue aminoacyl-tRNA hydrolase ArfB [Pseudomonadota bacterium]